MDWRVEVAFWLSGILAVLKVAEFMRDRVRLRVDIKQNMARLPFGGVFAFFPPGEPPDGQRWMVIEVRAASRHSTTLEQLVFRKWRSADDFNLRRPPDGYSVVTLAGLPVKLEPGTTWTGTVPQENVDTLLAAYEAVEVGVRDSVTGRTWCKRVLPTPSTPA